MSVFEELASLKALKAEEDKKELEGNEPEEEVEEIVEEAPVEEEKPEEKPKDKEAAPEVKPEEEKKPEPVAEKEPEDNAGWQRLRREAAANKKKADDAENRRLAAEEKLARLESGEVEQAETSQLALPAEVLELVDDRKYKRAELEFMTLESKFAEKNTDYHAISTEYGIALAQAIRIQNPDMSNMEVAEKTKRDMLKQAGKWANDGFDPIEELYHMAKGLGFTGSTLRKQEVTTQTKEEPKQEEEIRPDMKKVAANRAKSTGMGASGGEARGQMTQRAASDLTNAEWSKLPFADKQRLLYPQSA